MPKLGHLTQRLQDMKHRFRNNSEKEFDKVLRPKTLDDFSGQDSIIQNLEIFVNLAYGLYSPNKVKCSTRPIVQKITKNIF